MESRTPRIPVLVLVILVPALSSAAPKTKWYMPFDAPQTERRDVFEFTRKPTVRYRGDDRFEISFAVKDFCDATVSIIDDRDRVVCHVASGVLGPNAPAPFQKGSREQTIYWHGKDDLDVYVKEPGKLRVRGIGGHRVRHGPLDRHPVSACT